MSDNSSQVSEALNTVENAETKPFENTPEIDALAESEEQSEEGLETQEEGEQSEQVKIAEKQAAKKTEELKKEIKKYKLKIDGSEEEVSEDELIKRAQLNSAAQKRMQEAAQIRKEAVQLIQMLKENPESVLSDPSIGVDVIKFAQNILSRQLEEEQKSPEVREKERLEKEVQKYREELKKKEETAQKEALERRMLEQERVLETEIQDAFEEIKLPKKPAYLKKMSEIMLSFLDRNQEISAKDALKLAQKEVLSDLRELIDASPDENLEILLGKNTLSRVKKMYAPKVKKVVPPTASSIQSSGKQSDGANKSNEKKVTTKQWLRGF
jgi:hypothetical protein